MDAFFTQVLGTWHDVATALDLYDLLDKSTPREYYAIADTALPRNQIRMKDRIKTILKSSDRLPQMYQEQGHIEELKALHNFND